MLYMYTTTFCIFHSDAHFYNYYIGGRRLYDCDLSNIVTFVGPHEDKWEEIAIHLGFQGIENIKANPSQHSNAPSSYFRKMISEWLQWAPSDGKHKGYATVESLQSALRRSGLGVVAEKFDGYVSEGP